MTELFKKNREKVRRILEYTCVAAAKGVWFSWRKPINCRECS